MISHFRTLLSALLLVAVLFVSCKKGDPGPAGEQGPTGAQGPQGPQGVQGPVGTANVLYSGWVYATNFRDSIIDNSSMHIADIVEPKLTTDMVQKGAILVYFTYGGGVFPLPHITNAGGKSSIINFIPRVGKFTITRYTLDNSNSVNLSTVLQYRYILIPGGVSTSSAGKEIREGRAAVLDDGTVIDYAHMSYVEICQKLHILP